MKNVFLVLIFCLLTGIFCSVNGQTDKGKFQQHTGFYLSMSIGPTFGTIVDDMKGAVTDKLEFSGTGAQFDIKIGGAVQENLILHASMISTLVNGPKIKSPNQTGRLTDNLGISENMIIGVGLTYYIMPDNFFLSGSAGMGYFTLTDNKEPKNNINTDNGFSMQLKAGKEWWLGKRWGLGIALAYGKTILKNGPYDGTEERFNSNRFGILFNATFN